MPSKNAATEPREYHALALHYSYQGRNLDDSYADLLLVSIEFMTPTTKIPAAIIIEITVMSIDPTHLLKRDY